MPTDTPPETRPDIEGMLEEVARSPAVPLAAYVAALCRYAKAIESERDEIQEELGLVETAADFRRNVWNALGDLRDEVRRLPPQALEARTTAPQEASENERGTFTEGGPGEKPFRFGPDPTWKAVEAHIREQGEDPDVYLAAAARFIESWDGVSHDDPQLLAPAQHTEDDEVFSRDEPPPGWRWHEIQDGNGGWARTRWCEPDLPAMADLARAWEYHDSAVAAVVEPRVPALNETAKVPDWTDKTLDPVTRLAALLETVGAKVDLWHPDSYRAGYKAGRQQNEWFLEKAREFVAEASGLSAPEDQGKSS